MTGAEWLPYALPLRQPWQTHRGATTQRQGRLLRLTAADGRVGWGDCAPLPAFGIDEARATEFAEECAQLDLAAQRAGLPLDAWLSGRPPAAAIAVNASLGDLHSVSDEALSSALAAGYRVLKLKVGIGAPAEEIAKLRDVAARLPAGYGLRLDANGAWSPATALGFLGACRDLPVEACEEPLHDPDGATLAELQSAVPFAIAIDESAPLLGERLFGQPPVRRIVIKPARQGGLLASLTLAMRARTAGMEVVFSSALESSCGLLACAHLAAAVAPEAVHGLATAEWLAGDTGERMMLAGGRLMLPAAAGTGFRWAGATAAAFAAPA